MPRSAFGVAASLMSETAKISRHLLIDLMHCRRGGPLLVGVRSKVKLATNAFPIIISGGKSCQIFKERQQLLNWFEIEFMLLHLALLIYDILD